MDNAAQHKKEVPVALCIRRSVRGQVFRAMLLADVIILLLAAALFLYSAERVYGGTDDPRTLYSDVQRRFVAEKSGEGLPNVYYELSMPGKPVRRLNCTVPLRLAACAFAAVFLLELLWLSLLELVNTVRIKRQLKPLDRLAAEAQRLSRAPLDAARSAYANPAELIPAEKFHSLEHAIEDLRPGGTEVRLSTGDADLADLEDAINNLLSRMQESYRQQARFVSDASHELRTPIAVVKGYADMLARWGKSDEKVLAEGISAIQSESEHMNRLVEQLLFLARGDSGRTQLQWADVDLSMLLTEVYEESQMIHPDHVWQLDVPAPLPARGDPAMLKQAVRILVDNAVKYTAPGECIRLRAYQNLRGEAVMEVQDSGIGIGESELPHVFERFYRADPARKLRTGGTGLGLSIAKWIVDRHSGYFELASSPGIGTRFCICLPGTASAGTDQPGTTPI